MSARLFRMLVTFEQGHTFDLELLDDWRIVGEPSWITMAQAAALQRLCDAARHSNSLQQPDAPAAPEEKPALITDHEYLGCTLDRPDERFPRVPFQMASADLCHYEHDMGKPCAQPRAAHAPAQADREGR